MNRLIVAVLLGCAAFMPSPVGAQVLINESREAIVRLPRPPVPGPTPVPIHSSYKVRSVDVQGTLRDQAAQIQISQVFQNTGSATLEARLVFPIPDSAAISGLVLLADGKELTGRLLKKDEARRYYEEIVRRQRDPALLEFMGQGLYQTSVFPIPPQAERTVEIRYTQLLRKDQGLIDLQLPIGVSGRHSQQPVENLNVTLRVEATESIKTLYSPTHALEVSRPDETHAICKLALHGVAQPDDFRLLYGTQNGLVGMNIVSYRPHDNEDGYFVLLASPEVRRDEAKRIAKTVVFVCDRSGSMSGKKIDQAKESLKFLVNQLQPGDVFNIVAYDSAIESFRSELQKVDEPTVKAALSFVDGLYAGGGTNIDGALQTALKMLNDASRPGYVLFLTDGLPTVGESNEMKIAANARQANATHARLFCFGVGYDVNSRLLDRLANDLRGQSAYVKPNESIETHVAALTAKISSPLLTELALSIEFDAPPPVGTAAGISRLYPRQLTDLFQGEQLVVVGRYKTGGAAKVSLSGVAAGEKKLFVFPAQFAAKSLDESNGFVEKLWAMRRIGEIIGELDLKGHNQELVDELVQLSTRHGILTPYTSFLADENVNLADRAQNARRAAEATQLQLRVTDGKAGVRQRELKGYYQRAPAGQPLSGPAVPGGAAATGLAGVVAFDAQGEARNVQTVRNVGQKTFFRKDRQWHDSSVRPEQLKQVIRIKQFSREYFDLAASHDGRLAQYLVFEEPVILNLGDKTWQIDPPDDQSPNP